MSTLSLVPPNLQVAPQLLVSLAVEDEIYFLFASWSSFHSIPHPFDAVTSVANNERERIRVEQTKAN